VQDVVADSHVLLTIIRAGFMAPLDRKKLPSTTYRCCI